MTQSTISFGCSPIHGGKTTTPIIRTTRHIPSDFGKFAREFANRRMGQIKKYGTDPFGCFGIKRKTSTRHTPAAYNN